jgi:putative oxidoreductase
MINAFFLTPYALLALRLITATVFFSSGRSHVERPGERGKQIGMSPQATRFLGIMEVIAAISVAFGLLAQVGALIIMVVMLGAMQRKILVWGTGFYAEKGYGWHYDLTYFIAAWVIFSTDGGSLVLL